jgi:hypothetical protein
MTKEPAMRSQWVGIAVAVAAVAMGLEKLHAG